MSWADEFRGKLRRARQRRHPARRQGRPQVRRRGHRPVPHRAHVLRRGPHRAHAGDDPGRATRRRAARRSPKLLPLQRKDFAGLFKAMDGFPVVIRTLDPPLHEFLPKREELMVDLAKLPYADIEGQEGDGEPIRASPRSRTQEALPELLDRVEELHEFNPMLGHRGCRLGITYPGDHRDAGARHLRGGRSGGQEGQEGHPRSHDPADRRREGTREPEGDREAGGRGSSRARPA